MSTNANYRLSQPQVRGNFQIGFDRSAGPIVSSLAMTIPSTDEPEARLAFLDSPGEPVRRKDQGSMGVQRLRDTELVIKNERWRKSITLDADKIRYDQTGSWQRAVRKLGEVFPIWQVKYLMTLLVNGGTAGYTSYDGSTFFSTTHAFGDSGTQSNDLSAGKFNVSDPDSATPEEQIEVLMAAVQAIHGFKADNGLPTNLMARRFGIAVPTAQWAPTLTALKANQVAGGESNAVVTGLRAEGYTFDLFLWPLLSSARVGYVWRADNPDSMPLIISQDQAVQVRAVGGGENSEYTDINDDVLIKGSWVGGFGYGEPMSAVRYTLS